MTPAGKQTPSPQKKSSKKTSSTAAGRKKTVTKKKTLEKGSFFSLLRETAPGRLLLAFLIFLLILGVDFLLSVNHFDQFFLFVGIELILFILLKWGIFVVRSRKSGGP